MKSKRGALEVQFNWVFVMVAGALILVFFFGIVQKQREMSNAKIADSLLTNIESISTGAAVATGTVQPVDLPNLGIGFECTDECLCTYSIGDIRNEYKDKIIFAPTLIKGNQMILWTLDWKVPFRATNFVYATTRNDKYFFITDKVAPTALYTRLSEIIPPEVNAEFIQITNFTDLSGLKNQNYNSVKLVFVDTDKPLISDFFEMDSFRKTDLNAVYLKSGDAVFYDKTNKKRLEFEMSDFSYYGEPAILGAIFAGSANSYECNMISGLLRLQDIVSLYIARAEYLDDESDCSVGYSVDNLEELHGSAGASANDPNAILGLNTYVSSVKSQNDQLLSKSCAMIY